MKKDALQEGPTLFPLSPPLLPHQSGMRAARAEALERVERHAPEHWKGLALEAIRRVCLNRREFTTDAVWASGLETPPEKRALGPMMKTAERSGWCENTGRVRVSQEAVCHGRPKALYRSLIFGDAS